jgi:hypothetical protein
MTRKPPSSFGRLMGEAQLRVHKSRGSPVPWPGSAPAAAVVMAPGPSGLHTCQPRNRRRNTADRAASVHQEGIRHHPAHTRLIARACDKHGVHDPRGPVVTLAGLGRSPGLVRGPAHPTPSAGSRSPSRGLVVLRLMTNGLQAVRPPTPPHAPPGSEVGLPGPHQSRAACCPAPPTRVPQVPRRPRWVMS